jgi:ATP-dependent Clp protease adaptor protein ClpS
MIGFYKLDYTLIFLIFAILKKIVCRMHNLTKFGLEQVEVEIAEEIVEAVENVDIKDLIIFNDDFNTFDHVIETLIKVCHHSLEQAEQCTWIIHFKGKCSVKRGSYEVLKPMREAICDAGIDARIL